MRNEGMMNGGEDEDYSIKNASSITLPPLNEMGSTNIISLTETLHSMDVAGGGDHSLSSQTQTSRTGGEVTPFPPRPHSLEAEDTPSPPRPRAGAHSSPHSLERQLHSLSSQIQTSCIAGACHSETGSSPSKWSSSLSTVIIASFTQPVGPTLTIPDSVVEVFELFFH